MNTSSSGPESAIARDELMLVVTPFLLVMCVGPTAVHSGSVEQQRGWVGGGRGGREVVNRSRCLSEGHGQYTGEGGSPRPLRERHTLYMYRVLL